MSTSLSNKRSWLSGLPLLCWALSGVVCAEDAPPPFDGDWTLEFRVDTLPGRVSYRITGPMVTDAFNLHFYAVRRDFQFGPARSFSWEERKQARQETDSTGHSETRTGTMWDTLRWTTRGQFGGCVRVKGQGFGDAQNRSLKVQVHQWTFTDGVDLYVSNLGSGTGTCTVSADLSTLTQRASLGGSETHALQFWTSREWSLEPASIEREEQGGQVIQEKVTWQGRREASLQPFVPYDRSGMLPASIPVVEEIKLRQVRYLDLVPRG